MIFGSLFGRFRQRYRVFVLGCLLALSMGLGAGAAHAGEGGGEGKPAGPAYLRLKPITFSVIGSNNRINAQIGALLQLQLVAGKTIDQCEPFRRQIEDRFLIAMSELWDNRPDNVAVKAEDLKGTLLKAATEITGPGMVNAILIQELSERHR